MRTALTWISLALALAGCPEPPPARPVVDAHFIVVRLHLDPSSRVGEVVADSASEANIVAQQLGALDCTGDPVIVIHIEDNPELEFGRASLLMASPGDATGLCDSGGDVIIQPASYYRDTMDPVVQGPLLIEGQTLDGRLPLGNIGELGAAGFAIFPPWWEISGRLLMQTRDAGPSDLRVENARAQAVWRVRQLQSQLARDISGADPSDKTMLDLLVGAGVQPDVDVDGDGRERFHDTDGDGLVDRCVEGTGAVFDGVGCAADPRFADGYDLRLIFRLERVFPQP